MKNRLAISIGFILALFLSGAESAQACSCAGGANPCGFYRAQGGVAFIGTVTEVVEANEKYGQPIEGKVRKITIKVDEIFKGVLPAEVVTSDDGFSCDNFPFKQGESYLIYSNGILGNTANVLPVNLCSGTQEVKSAQEAINFLRQLKKGVMPSVLYGTAQRIVNDKDAPNQPLAKTRIVLTRLYSIENDQFVEPEKKDRKIEVLTNENGEFRFENLSRGQYKLSSVLPNDLWMPESREISTGGAPSCDFYPLYAFTNGSISGNVVNADGTPARISVQIGSVDNLSRYYYDRVWSDENGNFTISGLNDGKYRLLVSLSEYQLKENGAYPFQNYPYGGWFYPNTFEYLDAKIITLGYAQKISNINLKLPPFPKKQTVRGIVVWENGEPVAKATVLYKLPRKSNGDYQQGVYTNEDGAFSFEIFDDFEYQISAYSNSKEKSGFVDWFSLDRKILDGTMKIVLKSRE